jgi:hypothetical protein
MASDVDSFIVKFKTLWKAGRNANLKISVNAGKAAVTLHVRELEGLPLVPVHHQPRQSRNEPFQQRRRERLAAARQNAEKACGETCDVAAEATTTISAEEADI